MSLRTIHRFMDLLPLLSRGRFIESLDHEMVEAIEALEPHEKAKATLTVTLEFTRLGDRLDVKPVVKSKLPEAEGFLSTPFWTIDGGLSVQHPSQVDMFAGPRATATPDRETA